MCNLGHQFQPFIRYALPCILFLAHTPSLSQFSASPLTPDAQQQQRQQDRDRALREQQEVDYDVRLSVTPTLSTRLPPSESPCFVISRLALQGDAAEALGDPALGRCL